MFTPSDEHIYSGSMVLQTIAKPPIKHMESRQPTAFFYPTVGWNIIKSAPTNTYPVSATLPINRYAKSKLKAYIRDVLKLESHNQTQDHIIGHLLHLDTPDPMYVFLLPGRSKNQSLVLHKSNFGQAVLPSISPIQRHLMHSNVSKLYHLIEHIEQIEPHSTEQSKFVPAQTSKPQWHQLERPKTSSEDQDESESVRVVAENVRTERNFLRYMHYLNEHPDVLSSGAGDSNRLADSSDLNTYGSPADQQDYPKWDSTTVSSGGWRPMKSSSSVAMAPATSSPFLDDGATVGWKELGLDGWSGGIKTPGKGFKKFG